MTRRKKETVIVKAPRTHLNHKRGYGVKRKSRELSKIGTFVTVILSKTIFLPMWAGNIMNVCLDLFSMPMLETGCFHKVSDQLHQRILLHIHINVCIYVRMCVHMCVYNQYMQPVFLWPYFPLLVQWEKPCTENKSLRILS